MFPCGTSCSASECADDEQIALALQAQELAARRRARDKFKSFEDLIHRLFVCIAGVADQLQTNFAADLRNILKAVFLMNQTIEIPDSKEHQPGEDQVIQNGRSFDSVYSAEEVYADNNSDSTSSEPSRVVRRNTVTSTSPGSATGGSPSTPSRPPYPPDISLIGKVFCATCSSNSIPLPRFGQLKPVRVCEECYQTNHSRR